MGYNTNFTGRVKITPEVSRADERKYNELQAAAFGSGWGNSPKQYCQWKLSFNDEGSFLEWNGQEKFYDYVEWMEWLATEWFGPRGYSLNGKIEWKGEEFDDTGLITVEDNKVTSKEFKMFDEINDKEELARTALNSIIEFLKDGENNSALRVAREALTKLDAEV